MVKKKLWAHYERLKFIGGTYIALFFAVPLLSLGFNYFIYSSDIEDGVNGALWLAMLSGLKWYGIIMPLITVLFVLWFLYYSDTIDFANTSIQYHSWVFSKKYHEIPYSKITQVVFCNGLWKHKGEYYRGRKIIFYKIGFMELSRDQQFAILKYYCKTTKYKTGEEILSKK